MTEEQQHGVMSETVRAISAVATSLPPAFVALLAVNVIFIATLFWFLNGQRLATAEFAGHLLTACMQKLEGSH